MPEIHGDIGNGKFGVMDSAQIETWLCGKLRFLPVPKFRSNMQSCINDVMVGRGKDTGGRSHKGDHILHTSAGKSGQGNGCTLFYVVRDNDVAKVVGIGSHTGSSDYEIYWQDGNWAPGDSISL